MGARGSIAECAVKRRVLGGVFALALAWPAHAGAHCIEVSDIVGRSRCTRFGSNWADGGSDFLWPVSGTAGASFHWLDARGLALAGTTTLSRTSLREYRLAGQQLGPDSLTAISADIGGTIYGTRWIDFGFQFQFGSVLLPTGPITTSADGGSLRLTDAIYAAGGLVVGSTFRTGPVGWRLEALLGGRDIQFAGTSTDASGTRSTVASRVEWFAEPRAVLEWWPSHWLSAGAYGAVALAPSGVGAGAGVFIAAHLVADDARLPR